MSLPPKFIVAIDAGTTSVRVCCFLVTSSDAGAGYDAISLASQHSKEHAVYHPHPSWVEQDVVEIARNMDDCLSHAVTALLHRVDLPITAPDLPSLLPHISCIGLTNQRESSVAWRVSDATPYSNLIVWSDARTSTLCDAVARAHGGVHAFAGVTGLPIVPYFSASKMAWMMDHLPQLKSDVAAGVQVVMSTLDTYLLAHLTGSVAVEVSNAARTGLMNIHNLNWDAELCRVWGVPVQVLPPILPSTSRRGYGSVRPELPLAGVPVTGLVGDQSASLLGHAAVQVGDLKVTYGTGAFMLMNTGARAVTSSSSLLTTIAWQLEATPTVYALEGSVASAGQVVTWLRDGLELIPSAAAIEPLAASVLEPYGVTLVPAFTGLYAPHWRSDARGTLCGLSPGSSRAHVARAALESVAFQVHDLYTAMIADAVQLKLSEAPQLRVDGGMTSNTLMLQFQSDILQKRVTVPVQVETTALGAAFAAGIGVRLWSGTTDLKRLVLTSRVFEPSMAPDAVRLKLNCWNAAVRRSLNWTRVMEGDDESVPATSTQTSIGVGGGVQLAPGLIAAGIVASMAAGAMIALAVTTGRRS